MQFQQEHTVSIRAYKASDIMDRASWCRENIGEEYEQWYMHFHRNPETGEYYWQFSFADSQQAMLFGLIWL